MIAWVFSVLTVDGQPKESRVDSLYRVLERHSANDTSRVRINLQLHGALVRRDNRKAFQYANEALTLADTLSFETGKMQAHNALALCYYIQADHAAAQDHAHQSLKIAELRNNLAEKAESFRLLALSHAALRHDDKAKQYYYACIQAAKALQNHDLLVKVYCALSMLFYAQNEIDSTHVYLNASLAMSEKYHIDYFKPNILSQLGWVNQQADPNLAISYELKALEAARKFQNQSAEVSILSDLGKIYLSQNDYSRAERHLKAALQAAERYEFQNQKSFIYRGLIDLKIKQGNVNDVKHYVDAYILARDSSISEQNSRYIAELETQYDTEKKEQTIKILEQEKEIEALWRKGLISGTIVLLILLGTIYHLQKQRNKKSAELLETQRQLNAKLKETDAIRSKFFASVSHEFRTPISLILAPLEEKLKSPQLTISDKEDLLLVTRNANRLVDLVNQLLDFSKLEAGKMEIKLRDGNLVRFFTPMLSSFDSLAHSRGVSYEHQVVVSGVSHSFEADKLEKITTNLLSTAFKFTPLGGKVNVNVSDAMSCLQICVRDSGKGIPENDLPHIFSPFYQSGRGENTSCPGTGLGLALVHELVKVCGGTIRVDSKVNEGTSISVSLPLIGAKGDGESVTWAQPRTINHYTALTRTIDDELSIEQFAETLLIVEDNQELRHFVADYFKRSFHVITASNGREALELARTNMPTLILSDVMMPEMDGVEFMRHIKNDERTNHIPVILLTARAAQEEKIAALQLGTEEYLAKPFSIGELSVRISNIIDNRKKLAAHYKKIFESGPAQHAVSGDLEVPMSSNARFIERVRSVIYNNLGDSGFSVEKLAEEMCLSRAQLFRKVKMVLDTSPSDLISDIRLQQAAWLIDQKMDTLAQIAYAVGYGEQSYFAKRFRKKFGISPSEYADRMQTSAR
jgi:signal transduction histidine kinase/DNA-binding response OmpR family regulator